MFCTVLPVKKSSFLLITVGPSRPVTLDDGAQTPDTKNSVARHGFHLPIGLDVLGTAGTMILGAACLGISSPMSSTGWEWRWEPSKNAKSTISWAFTALAGQVMVRPEQKFGVSDGHLGSSR